MEIKVGDLVKIKSEEWFDKNCEVDPYGELTVSDSSLCCNFTEEMLKFCNKFAKVTKIDSIGGFEIDLDDGVFAWSKDWVETVTTITTADISSDYRILLFGDLFVIADIAKGCCIPEFFTTIVDAESYLNKEGI